MLFPAATARALLAGFRALGLDADALRREAGIDPEVLVRLDGVLERDCFARLWAAAFARAPRQELPTEVGMAVPFGAIGSSVAGSITSFATGSLRTTTAEWDWTGG